MSEQAENGESTLVALSDEQVSQYLLNNPEFLFATRVRLNRCVFLTPLGTAYRWWSGS